MKSRYWSFIGYPESLIPNFIDYLDNEVCVCFAISPLHDSDITPEGEKKKPHYHFLVQFSGPVTFDNVKNHITDVIGATIPKKVMSLRGYYRYFCHLDNPEKFQYDVKDIRCFNGFHLDLTSTEVTQLKALIVEEIRQKGFTEYTDIVNYYLDLGDFDRMEIVSKFPYFFDRYVSSKRYSEKDVKDSRNILVPDKVK